MSVQVIIIGTVVRLDDFKKIVRSVKPALSRLHLKTQRANKPSFSFSGRYTLYSKVYGNSQ